MKRNFLSMLVMVISVFILFGFSWAQCPEDPIDLGICDTAYVEAWVRTDTCWGGDCDLWQVNNPGSHFPCFLYVNVFLTHDSNTFDAGDPYGLIQDSISSITVPLSFWHEPVGGGDADSVIFPKVTSGPNQWNNTRMDPPGHVLYSKSMFRHFEDTQDGDTVYLNRFNQMVNEDFLPAWTITDDVDRDACIGDSGHMRMSLIASASSPRWWESTKQILYTMTFIVYMNDAETTEVCFDAQFWPPGETLSCVRIDAKTYNPRDNVPICFRLYDDTVETVTPAVSWVEVTSPNGSENWCAGSTEDITWISENLTDDVKIEYSTNGGSDWIEITPSTENDGVYPWNIPSDLSTSTTCRVRISEVDGDPSDLSDGDFTITGKWVQVVSPNGGEIWFVDSTYNITWTDSCEENISIEYSLDGGASWDTIVSSTPSVGSYPWQVPDTISGSCKVRICDIGGAPCDISDGNFSVVRPDFAIDVTPDTLWVPRGYSGDYTVILTSLSGFASPCTLTLDGLPGGSTATFEDSVLVPTDSTILTIAIPDTATPDTLPLIVTATEMDKGTAIVRSDTVTLIVELPVWNFKVDAFPDTQRVVQGDQTTYDVTIIPDVGFTAPCTLFAEGVPGGATADFDSNPLPPNDTSRLTITTTLATPPDTYELTIIGVANPKEKDTTYVTLIVEEMTDVEDESDQLNVPDKFALFQNQPNPFNPETKISYCLPEACEVKLTIYNILGRKVKTLFEGYQNQGMKTLIWDGRDDQGQQLGSGVYFYRLQAAEFKQTRKMTLIK